MDTTTEAQKAYMKMAFERAQRKPANKPPSSLPRPTPCYGCPAWKGGQK